MEIIIRERLARLREQMNLAGVKAWYISGTDPHQDEYLPLHWQSRTFISGFTGSAGSVIVTENDAALWTDSRYFLQAEEQLRRTGIRLMKMRMESTPTYAEWLASILGKDDLVGTDAACMSVSAYKSFRDELKLKKLHLKNTGDLLVSVWDHRPELPVTTVFEHELRYAGESRLTKIARIRGEMKKSGAVASLVTALDDLAWTFNLRGQDVDFNPVFVAYALITDKQVFLYINKEKVPDELKQKLHEEDIQLKPYEAVFEDLKSFNGVILIDPTRTNQALMESIPSGVEIINQVSVPAMLKAVKSEAELKNIRETMRKDGVAMVEFLYWLDQTIGKQVVTEWEIAQKLSYFRSLQEGYKGSSFFPIIGYKEAGAIIHRSVTEETAQPVLDEGILLFDSGGQYLTGTTDITRTVTLSEPTRQQKTDFTLVLKGMIGLSMAKFPAGTKGCNLDILARKPMWEHGLNYGHGTAHGIGYFLNVHEGPMSIRQEYNEHAIVPGMVMSNEPGFYREGGYGLRTENMMVCVEAERTEFGRFYGFQTLTLCPIDLKLVDRELLTPEETDWINDYHQWCYKELSGLLTGEKKEFLKQITAKLN
ncbi:aminopeptidase P family protein [Gaoshiqia sp. Z1-71]|uniref:aminopeptidase P family protein n=1 Tax=Gaoshiqia hydrogeniformans TaxID=3290090 RepID=UPI003BF90E10